MQATVSQDRYKRAETDVEAACKELGEMENKISDFIKES